MPMYGNTINNITHRIFANPDISERRNRSPATVMSSQNQRMNRKIVNKSVAKFVNVKPPSNSILSSIHFHVSFPPAQHSVYVTALCLGGAMGRSLSTAGIAATVLSESPSGLEYQAGNPLCVRSSQNIRPVPLVANQEVH